jgi:hypothetical protein
MTRVRGEGGEMKKKTRTKYLLFDDCYTTNKESTFFEGRGGEGGERDTERDDIVTGGTPFVKVLNS